MNIDVFSRQSLFRKTRELKFRQEVNTGSSESCLETQQRLGERKAEPLKSHNPEKWGEEGAPGMSFTQPQPQRSCLWLSVPRCSCQPPPSACPRPPSHGGPCFFWATHPSRRKSDNTWKTAFRCVSLYFEPKTQKKKIDACSMAAGSCWGASRCFCCWLFVAFLTLTGKTKQKYV